MKRCPKCNRKYNYDTITVCPGVRTPRAASTRDEAPPTESLPRAQPTLKTTGPTVQAYQSNPVAPTSEVRQSNPLLTGGVIAIALLLLLLVGIVAYFVITQTNSNSS